MRVLALFVSAAALASSGQFAGSPVRAAAARPGDAALPGTIVSAARAAHGGAKLTPVAAPSTIDLQDFETQFAPPASSSFAGLGDTNNAIPAGTHGAAGNGYLMETLNTYTRVQYASGGGIAYGPVLSNLFWTNTENPNSSGVFGPRVVYDPAPPGHWIVAASDEAGSASSSLLVAVSRSPVPDLAPANWYQHAIDVDATNNTWADYPSIGFSAQWVVVQVNLRRNTDGVIQSSRLYVFDKAALYGGNLTTSYTPVDLPAGSWGSSHVPAVTYDTAVNEVYLLQMWNAAAGTLRLYRLTGPTTPSLVGSPTAPSGWIDTPGDVDFAPQAQGPEGCRYCFPGPCPPRKIRVNDSRIQNVVYRNNHVWAAHTIVLSTPSRASVQWWQLGLDGSVTQRGVIDDPSGKQFFAFPSIAVNRFDDVLLGYSRFEDTAFATASYSYRASIDAKNTMRSDRTLRDGQACYYKDYTLGRNRWGDYSATVVDPDDLRMWTLQQYAEYPAGAGTGQTDDRWGTWWGLIDPRPRVVATDAWASETASPGTTRMVFDVSLLNVDHSAPLPTSLPVAVDWHTSPIGGGATENLDYVGAGGTLSFAPGETTKTIEVTVMSDLLVEGPETFHVDLTASTNAFIDGAQVTGTILDLPAPQLFISDVTKVEGNGGPNATEFDFQVTLSYPASVDVDWQTAAGTAIAGALPSGDFSFALGTVSFVPPSVSQTVKVFVHADNQPETDEVFYVDLTSATGGATLARARGLGHILDDDATLAGATGLSILSDSTASGPGDVGRNRLQWVNPPGVVGATVLISYNVSTTSATSCTSPAPGAPSVTLNNPSPGKASYSHEGLILDRQYCYTLWIDYGGTPSAPAYQSARPYDSHLATKNVAWKLATGFSLMPAPTVGVDAVIAVSNDMNVHALQRDPGTGTGGLWPPAWIQPLGLGSVAQHRVPVVPRGASNVAFISTQDGRVHAVDTKTGGLLWSTQLLEGDARGAPAGIFIGGGYNYLLVATSKSGAANHVYALDPDTGAVLDVFPRIGEPGVAGDLGEVYGMATVDYATGRVYFASYRGTAQRSLWCLELGPSSDALRLRWSVDLGADVQGSPVLRGGRVYVGDISGTVWSVPAGTGLGGSSRPVGGAVKGFLFPDRTPPARELYAATDTAVVALTDDGAGTLVEKWRLASLDAPSTVLLRPGGLELYVAVKSYPSGSNPASVLRIDTATGQVSGSVPLESGPQFVGAPSLDWEYNMIHVGSVGGVLYAVPLSSF